MVSIIVLNLATCKGRRLNPRQTIAMIIVLPWPAHAESFAIDIHSSQTYVSVLSIAAHVEAVQLDARRRATAAEAAIPYRATRPDCHPLGQTTQVWRNGVDLMSDIRHSIHMD
jgi:hypothetical protein